MHDLPPSTTPFIGRREAFHALSARVRPDRVASVWGPSGAGASRLAIEVARRSVGPAVFVDASCCETPTDAAVEILRALGAAPPPAGRSLRAHLGLVARPPLVVLDGAAVAIPEVAVIAVAPATDAVQLEPLAKEDAIRMFMRALPRLGPSPVHPVRDAETIHAIAAHTGGLPLAIELIAGCASIVPLDELAWRLDAAESGDPLDRALACAARALGPSARAVLGQLGVFAGPFDLEAARAVFDTPGELADALQELLGRNLLRIRPDGRFTAPLAITRRCGPVEDAVAARHAAHFLAHPEPRELLRVIRRAGPHGCRAAAVLDSWLRAWWPFEEHLAALCALGSDCRDTHDALAAGGWAPSVEDPILSRALIATEKGDVAALDGLLDAAVGPRTEAWIRALSAALCALADHPDAPRRIARAHATVPLGAHDPDLRALLAAIDDQRSASASHPVVESLRRRLADRHASSWSIADDGTVFIAPGEKPTEVRAAANARLLAALVADAGRGLDVEAMFAAGWPGQVALPRAAANRVRVAVSGLRAAGLTCLAWQRERGWFLDARIRPLPVPTSPREVSG